MTPPNQQPDVELVEITPWLWCLRTPLVQAYAVRERNGFNLIDTGTADGGEALLHALARIEDGAPDDVRVHEILLTHGHADHVGSAAELVARTGAAVLASATDAAAIEGAETLPPPQLADWEAPLYEQTMPLVPAAPPVAVDVRLDDSDTLNWAEPAQVLAVPGHTPGSIAVLFPRDRLLIAGDAAASHDGQPILGVFNSDPQTAQESFRRLARLDVETACFGHGEPLIGNAHAKLARAAASRH